MDTHADGFLIKFFQNNALMSTLTLLLYKIEEFILMTFLLL